MEGIRVNKISVNVNQEEFETNITLYRTNTNLGSFTTDDLKIVPFSESGVSLKAYQAYCRDIVINLIDNGGIEGFYYEPKEESQSVKYDVSSFCNKVGEYFKLTVGDNYEYKIIDHNIINIEQYKDKHIKNIQANVIVSISGYNIKLSIFAEIKSGQMCRPKIMSYNGNEYNLNITNINKIIKSL